MSDMKDQLINACNNNNLSEMKSLILKLEKNGTPCPFPRLLRIACGKNYYHIMKYLLLEKNCITYMLTGSGTINQFKYFCGINKINTIMNIIKITLNGHKRIIFNQSYIYKSRYGNLTKGKNIMQLLMEHTETHMKIIYYLESCGAKPINKKLII